MVRGHEYFFGEESWGWRDVRLLFMFPLLSQKIGQRFSSALCASTRRALTLFFLGLGVFWVLFLVGERLISYCHLPIPNTTGPHSMSAKQSIAFGGFITTLVVSGFGLGCGGKEGRLPPAIFLWRFGKGRCSTSRTSRMEWFTMDTPNNAPRLWLLVCFSRSMLSPLITRLAGSSFDAIFLDR